MFQVYANLGSIPLKQKDMDGHNKAGESTSTGFPSDNFNIGSKCFGDQLKSLRSKNRIILAQININSIKNKFDELVCAVRQI